MSIVLNYEGQTVQHSDLAGNIAHQGVLASNITGSTVLSSTFPTTNTGTSLGHYHYTQPTSNALQFLNCSGTGTGGHKFYTSNSTLAPVNTATIDVNGLTIDKSSSGTTPVYSPNVASLAPDGKNITMASSVYASPYNFNSQTFNPVYMTQTTSYYTAGDLCYAVAGSDLVIQIFNNNSSTNPIPPNTVPTGFANGDNTNVGITTGIPLFTLTPPSPPSIPQIVNLNEELTITTDTDECILSAVDLTFNNISLLDEVDDLQIKQITSSLQFPSSAITADGRPPLAPTNTIINTYAFSPSWYFKNTFNSGVNKINWYIGPSIGMTVANVLGLYMNIFNGLTTSNDNTPFIVIYTANDAVPPVNWYKSKRTYIFNQSITPIANTRYFNFANISSTCPTPNYYGSNLINMELSTVSGSQVGAFASTELILAFAINTNSSSPLNSVEFAINKFGIMTPNGTQEVLFIPST